MLNDKQLLKLLKTATKKRTEIFPKGSIANGTTVFYDTIVITQNRQRFVIVNTDKGIVVNGELVSNLLISGFKLYSQMHELFNEIVIYNFNKPF